MVVHHFFRLNDQFFVKDLGVEAQAGVAVGSMCAIFILAFGEMIGVGTMAIAARRFGEGNDSAGFATIRRGLRLGMTIGLGLAAGVLVVLPWLAELMIPGAENALERQLCIDYLTWIAGGQVFMVAVQVLDQSFVALKDTRTALRLQVLAVSTNALLNWVLVPHFGVHGVGAATVASRFLVLLLGLAIVGRRGLGSPLADASQGAKASRILRIGFPTCIAIGMYSLVYQVMLALTIKEFGPEARSALGIGFGIETIFYCLYWGVGTAVAGLVGRYLGEDDHDKATRVAMLGILTNLAIGLLVSIVFWTTGPTMVSVFSQDPDVVRVNTQYLDYMAYAQPFQAMQVAFDNALIGAGCTFPIMVASVTMNVLRIPLAHLFAILWTFGLPGLWWAINLSTLGKSVWGGILFARKKWLNTEV